LLERIDNNHQQQPPARCIPQFLKYKQQFPHRCSHCEAHSQDDTEAQHGEEKAREKQEWHSSV